jgi:uroporphyrinogen decarboxylase
MLSRELVIRTLNQQSVDRVPRDLWPSPGVESARADELAELGARYPSDIIAADFKYPPPKKSHGKPADYKPPVESLDAAKFAKVNRACETTTRFVLAHTDIRPFDQLQALHGPEAAVSELAHGGRSITGLLASLHEYYCRQIELWAGTEVDGVVIGDDWGAADSMKIAPAMWREIFRPLYKDYCKVLHESDKFVFFKSNGNISDIFGDLVKIGVDAVHSPWGSMNLERLAKRFRGQTTFWGGIDNPQTLQNGALDAIKQAAHAVRKTLDYGSGGVIAQLPWEQGTSIRALVAAYEQWLLPMPMHSA